MTSISDRTGVDRRRARGTLLGIRIGNQMLHPSWQSDRRRGDTLAGLGRVPAALAELAAARRRPEASRSPVTPWQQVSSGNLRHGRDGKGVTSPT